MALTAVRLSLQFNCRIVFTFCLFSNCSSICQYQHFVPAQRDILHAVTPHVNTISLGTNYVMFCVRLEQTVLVFNKDADHLFVFFCSAQIEHRGNSVQFQAEQFFYSAIFRGQNGTCTCFCVENATIMYGFNNPFRSVSMGVSV